MIVSKHDLPLHYPYALFNPQADPTTNEAWLRPTHDSTLYTTPLRNNDVVELLCEPSPLFISRLDEKDNVDLSKIPMKFIESTKKKCEVDFSEPLYKALPAWIKHFPFKKKKKNSNYCVLRLTMGDNNYAQVVGMLNINISPFEANLHSNGYLLLVSLEYFNRPASSVMNPTFVGYATLKIRKGEKFTKPKKYLFVQKYNILYYFSSRSSLSADGMIDLQYMTVTVKNQEVRLSLISLFDPSLPLLAPTPEFLLETDVHNIKELTRRVSRHSASGAGKHVFGVSLAHLWDRKFSPDLPLVVSSCCHYISKYGINTEGVFQDPGKKETMEMMRDEFDKGTTIDFDLLNPDPHSVGHLLKTYLMELPEPILTYALYPEFWKVRNNTNNVLMMLSSLPSQNQLLVKFLSTFFLEFVRHAAANRITLHGLALYFTPCFLRPKEDQVAHDSGMMSSVLATLIANCETFIPNQRVRSQSKVSRASMDVHAGNFSPPFPLHNKDPNTPPSTPPLRYSLRLEKIMESRPSESSSLSPPPSLYTPPASPSPALKGLNKPAPPSVPASPVVLTSSSSASASASASSLSLDSAPPPPSTPASTSSLNLLTLAVPSPKLSLKPVPALTPPPALPPAPSPKLSPPPALPPAPSPTPSRASPITTTKASDIRLSPSLPRPVFTLPPSPNTIRRTQGQTVPNASSTPASAAAYAAAAALDAAADARAAALAAIAALDYLDAGMSDPTIALKHGSIALGAPPPLPPLDPSSGLPPPPPPTTNVDTSPPSEFMLGAPPSPPNSQ